MNTAMVRLLVVVVVLAVAGYVVSQTFMSDTEPDRPTSTVEPPTTRETAPETPSDGEPTVATPTKRVTEASRDVAKSTGDAEVELDSGTGGLSGYVVKSDGTPVESVTVELMIGPSNVPFHLPAARKSTGRDQKTNADGAYHFGDLPPGANYVIVASHPDYAVAEATGLTVRGDDMQIVPELVLGQGPKVNGTVRGTGGVAVVGATVELWDQLKSNFMKEGEKEPWKTSETDQEGRYEFANVHFNACEVVVSAPGYATSSRSNTMIFTKEEDRTLDFQLTAAVQLGGLVVDSVGAVVEDALVQAYQIGQSHEQGTSKGAAYTKADGSFTIVGLANGSYNVTASAPGYSDRNHGTVEAGSHTTQIILERRGAVTGIVRDAVSGAAVRKFRLQIKLQRGDGPATPTGKTREFSSADGRFVFDDIDPNQYVVEAEAEGYAPSSSAPFFVNRGDTTPEIVVAMDKGGSVRGLVVNTAGAPVAGASVRLNVNNFVSNPIIQIFNNLPGAVKQRVVETRTNKTGEFHLDLVVPGTYQVEVTRQTFSRNAINNVEVVKSQVNDIGRVTLSSGGEIHGQCLNAAGGPFADGTITCVGVGGESKSTRPDYDGRFSFENLSPGEYKLTLNPTKLGGEGVNPLMQVIYAQRTETKVQVLENGSAQVTLTCPEAP